MYMYVHTQYIYMYKDRLGAEFRVQAGGSMTGDTARNS